ncbi:MAG: efflux RND transporter periplasmic adaptor subunit [Thiocapsa sp.]|jgi:HlyD family secretion protein|nr:efflux RND transporter periplasmic adaptor subunit [Thiocapsa sp.]MCG6895808.1 efflux RND transporter periplasmic adaptor subunit [Thiocapsa sp.]MCG6985753.1 efflux RND transporter periplasmic adaptor subunit [Thiocapsa sp.]
MSSRRRWLVVAAILLSLLVVATAGWVLVAGGDLKAFPDMLDDLLGEPALPDGFAMGNGRLEATEVDVATKLPGRLAEVRVREGDRVEAGQVVAVLDTDALAAQQRQARAERRRAQQEREYALAVVEQRVSELELARRELARLQRLSRSDQFVSEEQVDRARTDARTAEAALRAAQVQVTASDAAIEAAQASIERIEVDIADSTLKAPRGGRVLYRLAEPGEVLGAGGKVLTLLDLTDVYMVIFLPAPAAGWAALGAPARILLDAAPQYVIPAEVSFVAPRAQFTPKQVETQSVRENLAFRVKVRIDPELLARYEAWVKTGVPGVAYVQIRPETPWPEHLAPRLPTWPSTPRPPLSD